MQRTTKVVKAKNSLIVFSGEKNFTHFLPFTYYRYL